MPVADPTAGRACIWLISCILFLSLLGGAICLLLYMFHHDYSQSNWLPVLGVAFVCLPWAFWFLTCCYRIISRTCGFRLGIGVGPALEAGDGGAGGGGTLPRGLSNGNASNAVKGSFKGAQGGMERRVSFGQASVGNDNNDNSVCSRESEMPLAKSMAH